MAEIVYDQSDDSFTVWCDEGDCNDRLLGAFTEEDLAEDIADDHENWHDHND